MLGTTWYVVGGGNNANGCADMYSLDLTYLGSGAPLPWTLVGNTPVESAIASEGLSLLTVQMAGGWACMCGLEPLKRHTRHTFVPRLALQAAWCRLAGTTGGTTMRYTCIDQRGMWWSRHRHAPPGAAMLCMGFHIWFNLWRHLGWCLWFVLHVRCLCNVVLLLPSVVSFLSPCPC